METRMRLEARLCGPTDTDLAEYLRQIRGLGLLTREEEREFAVKFRRDGCLESRDRLICGNLRLAVYAARRYAGLGVPLQDLVEAGNVGLMEAAARFDPEMGTRFSTYAMWWIRRSILATLSREGVLIQIPADHRRAQRICREAARRLAATCAETATDEQIAQETGLPVRVVRSASSTPHLVRAADGEADLLGAAGGAGPDDRVETRELAVKLRRAIQALPGDEAVIVRWHYGLEGPRALPIAEIARRLGWSSSRVARHLRAALHRLSLRLCGERPARAREPQPMAG
jgi:RNA polymerase sigma factor (sigma-70 family)